MFGTGQGTSGRSGTGRRTLAELVDGLWDHSCGSGRVRGNFLKS